MTRYTTLLTCKEGRAWKGGVAKHTKFLQKYYTVANRVVELGNV